MNIYLVQHGRALPKEEDPQRPLSEKGLAEVHKAASYAANNADIKVVQIIHSGKLRAQQTAEVIAEHLKPAGGVTAQDGLEPNADPAIWAERSLAAVDDIMLVGHLPHLSRFSSLLLCGDPDKEVIQFCNAGIVCIRKDEAGAFRLKWVLTPEVVG